METGNIKHSRPVPPFLRWCSATIPAVFDDSLTYYEALCSLWKWLQTNLIEVVNNNATVTQEYIRIVDELKEFVDNYFENLDVQEEINNKLDAMAEDGTLEEIIGHYILGKVEYIFQKFVPNFASGDCCLIKTTNKNILFDTDNNNTNSDGINKWLYVQQMLLDNNVDHIDILIISHYHGDHVGNINNLIQNDYIDSETVAYLGCIPDTYGQTYINGANSVRSALENAGVTCTYPTEGQIVTLDTDFSAKFVNATKEVVDAYTVKNENNASMCAFFKHGNVTSFYAADANRAVFQYLYSQGYPLSSVELFKTHHHGLEPLVTKPFITELAPTYSVVTQYINDYIKAGTSASELYSLLNAIGSKVYCSFQQSNYIKFVSSPDAMTNISGKANIIDESQVQYDLYVDISVTPNNIQDGSQNHPFSQVNQAIGVIPNLKDGVVNVHIAAGDYNYFETGDTLKDRLYINSGKNIIINLIGDSNDNTAVKINGVYARNSYVNLKDLTLDCDNYRGIVASDSVVNFDNVLITSLTKESSYNDGLLFTNNSQGSNTGTLSFDKVSHCIRLQTNSKFNASNTINIGAHSDTIVDKTESSILYNRNYFSFATSSDKLTVPYYSVVRQPESILQSHSDTPTATSLTLTKAVSNYDWIEVYYQDSSTANHSSGRVFNFNNKTIPIFSSFQGGDGKVYQISALLRFNGTSGEILRFNKITIATDGTVTMATSPTNEFNILKIIGGYKDYVDLN